MWRWAEWVRRDRPGAGLGYGTPPMARAMQDMRTVECGRCRGSKHAGKVKAATERGIEWVLCPVCKGEGEIDPGAPNRSSTRQCRPCNGLGEVHCKTCIYCGGSGQRTMVEARINPAMIPSTVARYWDMPADVQSVEDKLHEMGPRPVVVATVRYIAMPRGGTNRRMELVNQLLTARDEAPMRKHEYYAQMRRIKWEVAAGRSF